MGQQQSHEGKNSRGGRRRSRFQQGGRKVSSLYHGDGKFQVHGDDDQDFIDEKIRLYKKELKRLVAHGVAKQHEHQVELTEMDNHLYRKRLELHKMGEKAKTFYTFWDYVKIVQSATPSSWSPLDVKMMKRSNSSRSNSTNNNNNSSSSNISIVEPESEASERSDDDGAPIPPATGAATMTSPRSTTSKSRSKNPSRSKNGRRRKRRGGGDGSTDGSSGGVPKRITLNGGDKKKNLVIPRTTDMTFTIFGFFEAYLLRRLHLALLLKNQSYMQRHRWNDIIVYCYDEIPATKRDTEQAKNWLKYLETVTPNYHKELEETLQRLLLLQDKLMYQLRSKDERLRGYHEATAIAHTHVDDDDDGDKNTENDSSLVPSIAELDDGEIDFANVHDDLEPNQSSFSYQIAHEDEMAPSSSSFSQPPPQLPDPMTVAKQNEDRIYAHSEFAGGTLRNLPTPEMTGRKSLSTSFRSNDSKFPVGEIADSEDSDFGSDSEELKHNRTTTTTTTNNGNNANRNNTIQVAVAGAVAARKTKTTKDVSTEKEKEKRDKRKKSSINGTKRESSRWSMSWKVPALESDGSESASHDDLKASGQGDAINREDHYGQISMDDSDDDSNNNDDNDDDKYNFVAQEAKQQPRASSALAGSASMWQLQKSVRSQKDTAKTASQKHLQLSTTGSEDE